MSISEQARVEAEKTASPGFTTPGGETASTLPDKGPIGHFTEKYWKTPGRLLDYLADVGTYASGIVGDYGVPIAVEALEALTASLRQGYGDRVAAREGVPTSKDIASN